MPRHIPIRVAVFTALVALAQAQPATNPAFDVASVKPRPFKNAGAREQRINPDGISFLNATLADCIAAAWNVKRHQISGPDWLTRDRFDIIAKAEGTPGRDRLMLMFQALLAERFRLALHREMKDLPVYSLVVAKGGPKFHPSTTGAAEKGRILENGALNFPHTSMQQFADFLAGLPPVDRPVLDNTGLTGGFDFSLRLFETDGDMSIADTKRALAAAEHVFTDIQEQLGLKLEPRKAPVEVLVIDRAERPVEN
jgi:uncharacterized protein (TIGR03435 family)